MVTRRGFKFESKLHSPYFLHWLIDDFFSLQPPTLTPEAERLRRAFSTLSLSLPIPTPPTAHYDDALEFSSKSDHSQSKHAGLDAIILQTGWAVTTSDVFWQLEN